MKYLTFGGMLIVAGNGRSTLEPMPINAVTCRRNGSTAST